LTAATPSRLRIVSLLPSATEIVAALGFGDALVGRSHECDFPAGVEELPVLTAPKLDPAGTSREIHEAVTRLLADQLSVYRVDAALLAALAPTHVVTQVHCEVCAVSLGDVRGVLADWPAHAGPSPRLVALAASTLDEVFADFRRVAAALGEPERGEMLAGRVGGRMADVARSAAEASRRPRVAAIEWVDPLMAAGNWIPEMIRMAGGRSLFGEAGVHSPWLDPADLVRSDPEVIVLFPCGFPLERGLAESGPLRGIAGLEATAAFRDGAFFVADGNQLFNRPGPRLAESLEVLAEILHPELFAFGHEGTAWRRWPIGSGGSSLSPGRS